MQFIPSTWRVVGVDADEDGERNPQDIDDAALATAVYLCSGSDDLATDAGQRAAVYRYNHSHSYVDLVISIAEAYLAGDYTSVPNGMTTSAGVFVPEPQRPAPTAARATAPRGDGQGGGHGGPAPAGATRGTQPAAPRRRRHRRAGGGGGGTGGDGGDGGGGDGGGTDPPARSPTRPSRPVDDVLTATEALAQCLARRRRSTTR